MTWDDITSTVQDATNLPGPFITFGPHGGTAIAPDDEDWAVVAGTIFHPDYINLPSCPSTGGFKPWLGPFQQPGVPECVATKDGADNFSYAGDMEDYHPFHGRLPSVSAVVSGETPSWQALRLSYPLDVFHTLA